MNAPTYSRFGPAETSRTRGISLRGVGPAPGRDGGIALLLVLIIFIVLYLVVFQLHFTTKMEQKIAQVRYAEVEAGSGLFSAALYVKTLLMEDLRQDLGEAGAQSGAGAMGGAPGVAPPAGPSAPGGQGFAMPVDSGAAAAMAGGASTSVKWYDSLRENLFLPNVQSVGNVEVKLRVIDGERRYDLNRLFDYVRLREEEVAEGTEDLREEDLVDAVEGRSTEDAEASLRERFLARADERQRANRRGVAADGEEGSEGMEELRRDASGATAVALDDLDSYEPEPPFLEPAPSRLLATEEMLRRAILMMFTINEDNGYLYSQKHFAENVAQAIVQYVVERRLEDFNNRILSVSELLQLDEVTPEVFYGPVPDIPDGEEAAFGDVILSRDRFGDLSARFAFDDEYTDDAEAERQEEIAHLMEQYGRFANLPIGIGADRLAATSLTRGMEDWTVVLDENEQEMVLDPPVPIGLRDLFTTFSTGKINLNSASAPVIFGLLLSLDEEEGKNVAYGIEDYRNRFQEEMDPESGVDRVDGADTLDLGQPRREPPLDPTTLSEEEASLEAEYQDMETNYFTSLQQIELIDGSDQGPEDLLRSDEGVERTDAEGDTLYRRVLFDLEKVVVFGSSYFEVLMKAVSPENRAVKTASVTLHRDVKRSLLEVVMWKEERK